MGAEIPRQRGKDEKHWERRAEEAVRKMREAVRDTEKALAKWQALAPEGTNFDDAWKAKDSYRGRDILAEGEWAHRRAQTYAAAALVELEVARMVEEGMAIR